MEVNMYKILIVEDDMVIARTVYKHLQSWGYEVQCVGDFQKSCSSLWLLNPTWCCWISHCHSTMDFIGATRFGRTLKCQ